MGLFNLPMSAGPADQVIGYDELGRPVRRSLLGTEYGAAYAEPAAPRAEAAPIQGRAERARASRDTFLGGLLGIGQEALRGFTAPGRAAQGEDVPLSDVWATALDYGLLGAPMPKPEGALGIFAGRNAKTADLGALAQAEDLATVGASRDEIWRDTGWFQGVDGQWRFEIGDRNFRLRGDAETNALGAEMRARASEIEAGIKQRNADLKVQPDLFPGLLRKEHGRLRADAKGLQREAGSNFGPEWNPVAGQRAQYAFDGDAVGAYPDLARDTVVRTDAMGGPGTRGSYLEDRAQLNVMRSAEDPRSVALHEWQHAVQGREDFARGANIGMAQEVKSQADLKIADLNERLSNIYKAKREFEANGNVQGVISADVEYRRVMREKEDLLDLAAADPLDLYKRYAGEAEARNVQTRRDFTPEQRRATPPWATQDVPDELQIVRGLLGQ